MSRAFATCLLLLAGCRVDRLSASSGSLSFDPHALSFPDTFVGTPVTARATLRNASRADAVAALAIDGPFALDAMQVRVPAAGSVAIDVRFPAADAGTFTGALQLGDGSDSVALSALARVVPTCTTTNPCQRSSFDADAGQCVIDSLPDGTACASANVCLEQTSCLAGTCIGAERSCDDGNACTADACDPVSGCEHWTVSCAPAEDACFVSSCDPAQGCVTSPAPDGTQCGPNDCATAQVCFSGQCVSAVPPDGSACAPATPCQAAGSCAGGVCQHPPSTALTEQWSYTAPPGSPLDFRGVADDANNLYWVEGAPCTTCDNEEAYGLVSATPDGVIRFLQTLGLAFSADGAMAVAPGALLLSGGWGGVSAYSLADGHLLWESRLIPPGSAPDGGSATTNWRTPAPLAVTSSASVATLLISQSPAIAANLPNAWIISLDVGTGAEQWVVAVNSPWGLVADELGNLYSLLGDSTLRSWTASGTPRWVAPNHNDNPVAAFRSAVVLEDGAAQNTFDGSAIIAGQFFIPGWVGETLSPLLRWNDGAGYGTPIVDCTGPCPIIPEAVWHFGTQPPDAGAWQFTFEQALTQPAMSADGTLVLATQAAGGPSLSGFSLDGTQSFACPLPGTPQPEPLLAAGRWYAVTQDASGNWVLHAWLATGVTPATQGWVADHGSQRRDNRPR